MKLLRYGPPGRELPGLLDPAGRIRSLAGKIPDLAGDRLSPDSLNRLKAIDPDSLPLVEGAPRLGPPVGSIGKLVCAGMNYRDHCVEAGFPIPTEPALFMKAPSAVSGARDAILIPPGAEKVDWEVELAAVIGLRAAYASADRALAHVAGYTILNDVSERAYQMDRGGQWMKGKSADSFAPLGPWLVTPDEIEDPQALSLWLDVNGERMQTGSTASMIFGLAELIAYISHFMTLLPGDVVATGTPPGVGMGRKPQRFLRPGDIVELGIDGLGTQRQVAISFADSPSARLK